MVKDVHGLDLEQLEKSISEKFYRTTQVGQEKVGLELELIPFAKDSLGMPRPVDIINENDSGSFNLIEQFVQLNEGPFQTGDDESTLAFKSADGGRVTFEPGGQIEYSSSSQESLESAIHEVTKNINKIGSILDKMDIRLFHGAINPWHRVSEVGLKMKKPRYRAMDQYMKSVGPYGQQMMRLTASLQVNLDFGDRETAGRRWLAANLLAPVFNAMFGNSPFMGGQLTGVNSYRSLTWQNLDSSRTGFPHLLSDSRYDGKPEDSYLQFALQAAVILLPDKDGTMGFRVKNFSFQKWLETGFNGWFPDLDDWETHLTTLFPEVRPKGFMECRFIDGLPKAWWAIPAILLPSIIYDASATEQVIRLLESDYQKLDQRLKQSSISGVSVFVEKARRVFEIGLTSSKFQSQPELLAYCERFYQNYTYLEKSPADDILQLNNPLVFNAEQYAEYEKKILEVAQPPAFALFDTLVLEKHQPPAISTVYNQTEFQRVHGGLCCP